MVVDGPIGAIVISGHKPLIMAAASLRAHREFDDYSGPVPGGAPAGLADALAEYRREWEASLPAPDAT